MSDSTSLSGTARNSSGDSITRRGALKCLAFGGAGTLFALAGGVFTPIDLAVAAADRKGRPAEEAVRHSSAFRAQPWQILHLQRARLAPPHPRTHEPVRELAGLRVPELGRDARVLIVLEERHLLLDVIVRSR